MNLFYFIALFHSWQHKTSMLSWKFNFKKENEINLWSCDTQPSLLSWNRLQTQTALCRSIAFRSASKKHIVLQVRLSPQLSCFVKPLFPVCDFVSLLECGWTSTWRNDAVAGYPMRDTDHIESRVSLLVFQSRWEIDCSRMTGLKLINVLYSREISTDSFCDPIGSCTCLINEILLDKCVCLFRVIRDISARVTTCSHSFYRNVKTYDSRLHVHVRVCMWHDTNLWELHTLSFV